MKTIIGFDLSGATCGYGVLQIDNESIKYLDSGYFKPNNELPLIEKLASIRQSINNLLIIYNPDYIGIENIVEYMGGKSSSKSIIKLTEINRMTALTCYDYLQSKNKDLPKLFSVMSIRHGIKINKIFPDKEQIPELVSKHLNITFPWIYKKVRGKADPKPIIENYDRADGIAVSLYYAMILTGKIIQKVTKPKKSKKSKKT